MKKLIFILLIISLFFSACKNDDWEFPDYDYTTVYFAYQSPIRTITLGEDIFDTSLDNEHKCEIIATMGGVYKNHKNVVIDYRVDNSLCNNLTFKSNGEKVLPMPEAYYSLLSDKITIPKGEILGRLAVQLNDAFFEDPLSLKNTYVIPIVLTDVQNADSLLVGDAAVSDPNRFLVTDWNTTPKDYVLYAIKYINPWHANYLRRGKDIVTGKNGDSSSDKIIIRHKEYVEKDEVCNMTTVAYDEVALPLTFLDKNGYKLEHTLILKFDDNGQCVISSEDYATSGTGSFVKKGDKNSWGNIDRDVIYLDYTIDFGDITYATKDTLVVRDRGISLETFEPVFSE